mgnify:CR=1 FL=1
MSVLPAVVLTLLFALTLRALDAASMTPRSRSSSKTLSVYSSASGARANEISLRRILNVPKRGIGERAEACVSMYAERERIGFADEFHLDRRNPRSVDKTRLFVYRGGHASSCGGFSCYGGSSNPGGAPFEAASRLPPLILNWTPAPTFESSIVK